MSDSNQPEFPPIIQAIRMNDMEKLESLLNDSKKPANPNTKHNGLPALRWAQYNVEASRLLLDKGANPFARDPISKTTEREQLEGTLEFYNAKGCLIIDDDTAVKAAQIVVLLKSAEKKWLETHPGADKPYTGTNGLGLPGSIHLSADSFPGIPFRSGAARPTGP